MPLEMPPEQPAPIVRPADAPERKIARAAEEIIADPRTDIERLADWDQGGRLASKMRFFLSENIEAFPEEQRGNVKNYVTYLAKPQCRLTLSQKLEELHALIRWIEPNADPFNAAIDHWDKWCQDGVSVHIQDMYQKIQEGVPLTPEYVRQNQDGQEHWLRAFEESRAFRRLFERAKKGERSPKEPTL